MRLVTAVAEARNLSSRKLEPRHALDLIGIGFLAPVVLRAAVRRGPASGAVSIRAISRSPQLRAFLRRRPVAEPANECSANEFASRDAPASCGAGLRPSRPGLRRRGSHQMPATGGRAGGRASPGGEVTTRIALSTPVSGSA